MKFTTVSREAKAYYDQSSGEASETQQAVAFAVEDGDIVTQLVGFKKRRRRFLITGLGVRWVWKDGKVRRYVNATGPTILANGAISTKSTGFEYFWDEKQIPQEIVALIDREENSWST